MSNLNIIPIASSDDARVASFRDIREKDLTGRQGCFIAEGEVVLRQLVSSRSRCRPKALLLAEKRLPALEDALLTLDPEVPVYVAAQSVLDGLAGFHLHRGILALGEQPPRTELADLLKTLPAQALVVLACGIGNHDNMGGIFRNAEAFGADAVLLDRGCCDPFYRKSIRVSVGAVLRMPMASLLNPLQSVSELQAAGFEVLAMTGAARQGLDDVPAARRIAILLGSEGPGLPEDVIAHCRPVGIRMANGFDSLNVATAGAIALHHFANRRLDDGCL